MEMSEWTKKRKGNAKIYTNPISDFAIVENHYGVIWNGQHFPSVEEAKKVIENMSSVSFAEELRQAQQEARKRLEEEKKQARQTLDEQNATLLEIYEQEQAKWVEKVLPVAREKMIGAANQALNAVRLTFGRSDVPYAPTLMRKRELSSRPEQTESWRILETVRLLEKALGEGIKIEYTSWDRAADSDWGSFSEEYMDISWK